MDLALEEATSPSQRGGSVWKDLPARKSPDVTSSIRSSLNNGALTPVAQVNNKRRAAAEFIRECTGLDVPYSNDLNFRQALRDGNILCSLLGKVVPGAIKVKPGADSDRARVEVFLTYINHIMQPPSEVRFSMQDLLSEDYDDRPRIADCILWLKKLHSGYDPSPSPYVARELSDTRAVRDSPRKGPAQSSIVPSFSHLQTQQPTQTALVPTGPRTMAAVQPSASLAALCTDISNTLMSRLSPGTPVPTQKYDMVVTNVMEQFLSGLTIEYERRLVAKDQELYTSRDAIARLQKQMDTMSQDLGTISAELEEQKRSESKASQEVVERLRSELAETERLLAERTAALDAAQAALCSSSDVRSEREEELAAQLEAARAQIESYADLNQRFINVREENMQLYNTIQDLKGSIRVFCRVRPLGVTNDPSSSCLNVGLDGEVAVYGDKANDRKLFKFDKVFSDEHTQSMVYEDVGGLVRSVMDGFNVTIFAYGQTGSGKTHTMTGTRTEDDIEGRGINYRALDDLFSVRTQREGEMTYAIKAQMLEIYNETIQDLLTSKTGGASDRLDILSTQPSGLNVPGATQILVENTADVEAMMRVGAANRKSAQTLMNSDSSRSHQVLTIIVDGFHNMTGSRIHACLHLIDLAGSERTEKSGVEGDRLKEANAINQSLSALGTVMHSLASKSRHVPFRNSKLTELLADSLSGQAKVCMLMHVAPEGTSRGETISTLNFGNRVASVTLGQAKCNVESGKVFEAHEALSKKDQQITELREQLRQTRDQNSFLRTQLAALQGDSAPPLSARSESFRTANTHIDSAASTPASRIRTSLVTPRGPTGYGCAQVLEQQLPTQTPRFGRSMTMTPRTSSGAQTARGSAPQQESMAASTSERQDKVGPMPRGVPSVNATGKPASGRNSLVPRLDTSAARSSSMAAASGTMAAASGTMSARPSSKYGAASRSFEPAPTATSAHQQQSLKNQRPATSRAGNVYGGSTFSGPVSRSASVILPEAALGGGKSIRPPMSSRPGSGWK